MFVELRRVLFPILQFFADVLPRFVRRLDFLRAADEVRVGGALRFLIGEATLQSGKSRARAGESSREGGGQLALLLDQCRAPLQVLQNGFFRFTRRRQLIQRRLQFPQPTLSRFLLGEFRVDLCHAPLDRFHFGFDSFSLLGGSTFVFLPNFETQNVAQHVLAFGGVLLRELVRLALQKK